MGHKLAWALEDKLYHPKRTSLYHRPCATYSVSRKTVLTKEANKKKLTKKPSLKNIYKLSFVLRNHMQSLETLGKKRKGGRKALNSLVVLYHGSYLITPN